MNENVNNIQENAEETVVPECLRECLSALQEQFGVIATYWFCKLNAYSGRYIDSYQEAHDCENKPVTTEQAEAVATWYDEYAESLTESAEFPDLMQVIEPWRVVLTKREE